ncbi:MAG: hypothetical protein GY810_18750 [Aureispira sp.]|nr:hypothetical protein [Aureispira sp.]
MKNTYLLLCTITLFLASCGSDCTVLNEQNAQLQQRIKDDSLLLADWGEQTAAVNGLFDEVEEISSSAGSLEGEDLEQKAQLALGVIEKGKDQIAELEKKLAASKSSYKKNKALKATIKTLKTKLADYENVVEELKEEHVILTGENQRLQKIVFRKTTTITERDVIIEKAEKQLDQLNAEIQKMDIEKKALEKEKEELNKKKNDMYVNIARQLIQTAEGLKGGVGGNVKKTKQEMASKAYDILCDAHKNKGVFEALGEMHALKTNPKLGKLILDKNCE